MGKTPERRASTLRYRRKEPDNQQSELPADAKFQPPPKSQHSSNNTNRSSRSPAGRRFRFKPRQSKQQSPPLLKQLLWKVKAVQPTPDSQNRSQEQEEEEEEEAYAAEQRQARKLLASEAQAQNRNKTLALEPSAESSQETQSGSEDEATFLRYSSLQTTKWHVYKQQENEEMDAGEAASPVEPSEDLQDGFHIEKTASTRRKQRQKYKLKQKQKRAAAKEQKRLRHQQKQLQDEKDPTEEDAGSTQDEEDATVDIFHPPTDLANEMDAGVCRAVLSQLKDVTPFIVVGDVACPVVAVQSAFASDKSQASAPGSHVAVVDFRQHVLAMLDRSKEAQMQYRESFMVEESGFDAASSYDFFKRRFCEIQRSAGIVYY